MTPVEAPPPARSCVKCGALPGAYCQALIGGYPSGRHLKGNRSHVERSPSRMVAAAEMADALAGYGAELAVGCPVCGAKPGLVCHRVVVESYSGTPENPGLTVNGVGRPKPHAHLSRRLAAQDTRKAS